MARGVVGDGSKSLVLTCLLWLTLGWLGAHHFYLGRDRHAFVWLVTLGGGFGIGWLAEIWRLPEYARAANNGGGSVRSATDGRRPPVTWERLLGQFIFSMYVACMSVLMTAALVKTSFLLNVVVVFSFLYTVLLLCVVTFTVAAGEMRLF